MAIPQRIGARVKSVIVMRCSVALAGDRQFPRLTPGAGRWLGLLARALERRCEPAPKHTLPHQPGFLDNRQGQFGPGAVVNELEHALAERRLRGGGAARAVRRIEHEVVLVTSEPLHAI